MLPDKKILYILMSLQVLILSGMIASSWYPLYVGTEIRMKVYPLDPRDLLRGSYVRLNYDFNQLELDSIQNHLDSNKIYNFGEVVFVELAKEGDYYKTIAVWEKKPSNTENVFLKTSVAAYSQEYAIYLSAGLESYYTKSQKALQIEKDISSQEVYAVVKVAPNGQARLLKVELAKN